MNIDESGAPWPYERPAPGQPEAPAHPSWECPEGICVCHPELGPVTPVRHQIVFFDERAQRMPGARCRVLENGKLLNLHAPYADAGGLVAVDVRSTTKTLELEWAPPGTPLEPGYPFRKLYYVAMSGELAEDIARRLHNLGYGAAMTLRDNIRSFQLDYRQPETGLPEDVAATLIAFHDDAALPPRPPAPPRQPGGPAAAASGAPPPQGGAILSAGGPQASPARGSSAGQLPLGAASVRQIDLRVRIFMNGCAVNRPPYVLRIGALMERSGTADDFGVLEERAVALGPKATIFWTTPDHLFETDDPFDQSMELSLDYASGDDSEQATKRLTNLGYIPVPPARGAQAADLTPALRAFQRDAGLAPTGTLTAAIRDALADNHDHLIAMGDPGLTLAYQAAADRAMLQVPAGGRRRLRLSLYCSLNHFEDPSNFDRITDAAAGCVDEIDVLEFYRNTQIAPDLRMHVEEVNPVFRNWWPILAEKCSAKHISLRAGFALMGYGEPDATFVNWLHGTPRSPQVSPLAFAQELAAQVRSLPDCAGISFDIEAPFLSKPPEGGNLPFARQRLTDFYLSIARELAPQTVAVIVPCQTHRDYYFGAKPNGDPVGGPKQLFGLADYRALGGAGVSNLIVRPMGYDYYTHVASPPTNEYANDYHQGVLRHALDDCGISSARLQLAIKVVAPGLGNSTPERELLYMPLLEERSRLSRSLALCREREVGVALFTAKSMIGSWRAVDRFLNRARGAPPAGAGGGP